MMQKHLSDLMLGLQVSWPQFSQGIVYFFWPLLFALLLSLTPLVARITTRSVNSFSSIFQTKILLKEPASNHGNEATTPIDFTEFLEYLFFAIFGIAIAYIEVKVGGLLVQGVLPGVLTVATVLAQLVGRAVPSMEPPLDKRKSLANASLVCVGFLLSFQYFSISTQAQNGAAIKPSESSLSASYQNS
jgi:hypothetical protein